MPENSESNDFFGSLEGYAPSEQYSPTEEEKKLVQQLRERELKAIEAKRSYEQDWVINNAYLKGEAVARNRETGDVVRLTQEDSKRLRSKNNMLRPIARSYVGKLGKMIPACKVAPASADFNEQHGARVGDAIFEFLRRKEDLDRKFLRLINYLPWAGNSFLEVIWDPQAGAKVSFCDICDYYTYDPRAVGSPCPQCTAQRESEIQVQANTHAAMQAEQTMQLMAMAPLEVPIIPELVPQVEPPPMQQGGPLPLEQEPPSLVAANEGDVRFIVRDPRDVILPNGVTEITEARWVRIRETVSVDEARIRYPEHAQHIQAESGLFTNQMASWRHGSMDRHASTDWLDDHVNIDRFYERPTGEHENGRMVTLVNDVVVEDVDSPYEFLGRIPVFHFGSDINEGEFWREPWLNHAWHRQRELDAVETQKREHVELFLKQKMLVPLGAMISQDEFTSQSAQVVEYNAAAGEPRPMQMPQLPQALWQRGPELVGDMRMMASVTDQEQGIAGSDPNGRAMAIINAESDQQLGPTIIHIHTEWREAHRTALNLVQRFYHPDRKITVAGPEGVQTFSFNELNLQPGYDVVIEETDGLSRNPAIRFNETMQLAQVGYFVDASTGQFDKKAFARHAKLKMADQGYDTEAVTRAAASQIPYLVAKGMYQGPRNFDNPQVFYAELSDWLNGPGRTADPQVAMQVEQIWMYYAQWMAMLQGQMVPPGMAPPMPGQPSPAGGGMSAPGGSPNNPAFASGGGSQGNVQEEAQQAVQQADQTGDSLARGMVHES